MHGHSFCWTLVLMQMELFLLVSAFKTLNPTLLSSNDDLRTENLLMSSPRLDLLEFSIAWPIYVSYGGEYQIPASGRIPLRSDKYDISRFTDISHDIGPWNKQTSTTILYWYCYRCVCMPQWDPINLISHTSVLGPILGWTLIHNGWGGRVTQTQISILDDNSTEKTGRGCDLY